MKVLADAARRYEEIAGDEVDIEEEALAQSFKKLAAEDREMLRPLLERMKAAQLPGVEGLVEFQETIDAILEMPADDCVKTLAGEGKSYQEARARMQRLNDVLTEQNLRLLRTARRVLQVKYPILKVRDPCEEVIQAGSQLKDALEHETFYQRLELIQRGTEALAKHYRDLYSKFHEKRRKVYEKAVDDIKGLPEWLNIEEAKRESLLSALSGKICETLELADDAEVCKHCRATIAQMESEVTAVDTIKAKVIRDLQELASPERKIIHVHVSEVLGNVVETPEDVEQAVERLKEHLLKLLAKDARIILE